MQGVELAWPMDNTYMTELEKIEFDSLYTSFLFLAFLYLISQILSLHLFSTPTSY